MTLENVLPDPIQQFTLWLEEARKTYHSEAAEAMCVSGVHADGYPDSRIVLLKGHDARGFVFYTNLHSVKGRSFLSNPKAAATFYWDQLSRQVRLQGLIDPVSTEEADAYFQSRPRLSQISSWASHQSGPLPNRAILDKRVEEYTQKYEGQTVPRPPHWSGLRLKPHRIEFWQARPNRLHDRFLYTQNLSGAWSTQRLYP